MTKKLLFLIILVGLFLRLWGVKPGFPPYHPDEPQVYERALLTILGRQEDLGYYGYPGGVPLLHSIVYLLFFLPLGIILGFLHNVGSFGTIPFQKFLGDFVFGPREINVLYWGRYTNAVLGSLSILLTYLVGKNYFNKFVGLASASFLAVNYRHVLASHFSLVDVPSDLFLLLVFLASIRILEKGQTKDYILSGLAAALSFSAKFSPFALVSLAVAHLVKNRKWQKLEFWRKPVYLLFVFVVTAALINYFHIFHLEQTMKDFNILTKRYAAGIFEFTPFPYFYLYRWGIGPLVSVFTLAGVLWALKNKPREALIIVLPVFLFFFSLSYFSVGGVYVRNLVGVIPVLLIFAGCGIYSIYEVLSRRVWAKLATLTIILIALAPSTRNSLVVASNYSQPWNLTQVERHLSETAIKGRIAGTPWFLNYIFGNSPDVVKIEYGLNGSFSLPELQEAEADDVLVDTDVTSPAFTWWMGLREDEAFSERPDDLMYATLLGSVLHELIPLRETEFIKPWQAPETNFFLVKIPEKPVLKGGATIFNEDFESVVDWSIKGSLGKEIPRMEQVVSGECLREGCVKLGPINEGETGISFFESKGVPRFLRFSSPPIGVEPGFLYRVTAKIRSEQKGEVRDGFFKVELYKNREDAESKKAGKIVFVSARHSGSGEWEEKEVFSDVPEGYQFATISFQIDRNGHGDFYFDDVVFEKGQEFQSPERKDFPEDIIFINSIL